jgi:hypothetical protein
MHNEVMFNAQCGFGNHVEGVSGKQIEIIMNASSKGILNGNNGEIGHFPFNSSKDVLKSKTWKRSDFRSENFPACIMAECADFPLNGDSGCGWNCKFLLLHKKRDGTNEKCAPNTQGRRAIQACGESRFFRRTLFLFMVAAMEFGLLQPYFIAGCSLLFPGPVSPHLMHS